MKRMGISQKFILFISLSVLAFLACTLLISQDIMRRHALRTADELASTILDRTNKQIAQFFDDMEFLALGLASTKPVLAVDPAGMRDLFLANVLARKRYLRAIYLGTADGRMYEWGDGEGFIDHTPSFPPGYDPRNRPWYLTAIQKGGFSVSAPYLYASVDELGITCVLPVKDERGVLIGVLGLDILLDSLASILDDLEIPKDGRAIILDSEGLVIASQFPTARSSDRTLQPVDLPGGQAIFQSAQGSFASTIDGRDIHFVFRRVDSFGWIIAVGMPYDAILASTRELLKAVTLFDLIMMSAMILAVAGITGRLIISPLNYIVSIINRKEGGQRNARVTVKSGDEFGFLARELNKLFDVVDGYSSDLEAKVKRRTEEMYQLQQENTRLRIAEERKRIYRDMHDSIGAKLTNIFFCNGVARNMAGACQAELSEMFDGVESNCLEAVQSLKEIVFGMKEDDLIASDTAKFLSLGIRQRLKTGGIEFDCRISGRETLNACPAEIRSETGKVFEELVSNVLKHAGASKVKLRIKADAGGLSIRFSDDGGGMRPGTPGDTVSGLNNIRYRIERLGGTMSIESAPDTGTLFIITIPIATPGFIPVSGASHES
ncbi:MAG: cache domain-containing protein [Clostridia bacterium]